MLKQIKKTLAVLLAVCFLATFTAGAVSAHANDNGHYIVHEAHHKHVQKSVTKIVQKPVQKQVVKVVKKPVQKQVVKIVKKPVQKQVIKIIKK